MHLESTIKSHSSLHFEQLVGRLIPPLPIEDFQLSAIIAQIDHKYVAVEPGIILLSRKVLCTHPKISQKCTNNISSGEMLPYLDKHPLFLFFFSFLHKTSRRSHSQMLYPNPYYNNIFIWFRVWRICSRNISSSRMATRLSL